MSLISLTSSESIFKSFSTVIKSSLDNAISSTLTDVGHVTCFLYDYQQKYYHGESIAINVLVDNNTNKSVKKIKISGELEHFMYLFEEYFNIKRKKH